MEGITIRFILTIFSSFCLFVGRGQSANQLLYDANKLFQQNDFQKASAVYRKVLQKELLNETAKYNLGISESKAKNHQEAIAILLQLTKQTKNNSLLANCWYNIGVCYAKQQQSHQALQAFKNGLKLNPSDNQCRQNIQMAVNDLKRQNLQEQHQQGDKVKDDLKKDVKDKKLPENKTAKSGVVKSGKPLEAAQQAEKRLLDSLQHAKGSKALFTEKDW